MPLLSTVGRAHDASTTRPPPPSRYKGLALNLIKNPLATGVSLTVNDCVKDMLRPYRRRAEGR